MIKINLRSMALALLVFSANNSFGLEDCCSFWLPITLGTALPAIPFIPALVAERVIIESDKRCIVLLPTTGAQFLLTGAICILPFLLTCTARHYLKKHPLQANYNGDEQPTRYQLCANKIVNWESQKSDTADSILFGVQAATLFSGILFTASAFACGILYLTGN